LENIFKNKFKNAEKIDNLEMGMRALFEKVESMQEQRDKDTHKFGEAIHMIVRQLSNLSEEIASFREPMSQLERAKRVDTALRKSTKCMNVRS
jgi:CII-binding regulator of phage lambda lysogenization HflD